MTTAAAKRPAMPATTPATGTPGWRSWAPWLLGLVLLLVGAPAFYARMVENHHGDVTSYVPWGLWVGAYVYLVWLEVGSVIVYTVITYVLDRPDLKRVSRAVLLTALVALLSALFLIAMDLGHVWRFYKAFTQPEFSSPMSWMIWLHTLYLVILIWELWMNVKPDLAAGRGKPLSSQAQSGLKRTSRVVALTSLPIGVVLISVIGGLFGVVAGRPYWNASILPAVFFVSSLVAGCGLITVIAALFWPGEKNGQKETVSSLRTWTLGLLVVAFFVTLMNAVVIAYPSAPAYSDALKLVLFGPYWWSIWIVHGLFGLALPMALLASKKASVTQVGVAALLLVATFVMVPLNIIIPGQVLPPAELQGLANAYQDAKLTFNYFPSQMDLQMVVFAAGIGVLLLTAGARFLPIATRKEG